MLIKYKGQVFKRIDNGYDKYLQSEVMSELNKLYNETHRLEQKLGARGLFHQFKGLSKDYDEILKAWNNFITKAENSLKTRTDADKQPLKGLDQVDRVKTLSDYLNKRAIKHQNKGNYLSIKLSDIDANKLEQLKSYLRKQLGVHWNESSTNNEIYIFTH